MKNLRSTLATLFIALSFSANASDFVCKYTKETSTLVRNTSYAVTFNHLGFMTVDTVLDSKRTLADGNRKDSLLETSITAFPTMETKKRTVNGKVVMDAEVFHISGRYDYKLVINKANNNTSLIVSRTRIKEAIKVGQMNSHSVPKTGGKTVVSVNCSKL